MATMLSDFSATMGVTERDDFQSSVTPPYSLCKTHAAFSLSFLSMTPTYITWHAVHNL